VGLHIRQNLTVFCQLTIDCRNMSVLCLCHAYELPANPCQIGPRKNSGLRVGGHALVVIQLLMQDVLKLEFY
jgi:hypothetical protein